jgi:PA domain
MSVDLSRNGTALKFARAALAASLALATGIASAAATIVLVNVNAAGEGFNDPTVVAPVGGNLGTTLGQQRLNAFQFAANIWGATLTSTQTITVRGSFVPLDCTESTGILARAGALNVWRDFINAPKGRTIYPQALANKITNTNLSAGNTVDGQDIVARFNSRLGLADCLPDSAFYLGLDNNHGQLTNFVNTVLHELGHGLGFQTFTDGATGVQFDNAFPTIWDHFTLDTTTNKLWVNMTDAERVASAVNFRNVVWAGANVTNSVPQVLSQGTPTLTISGPAAGAAAGTYNIGTASFGAPLGAPAVTAQLMPVVDSPNQIGLACNPLSAVNALAVNGRVALVDRGTCLFTVKAKNVQNAGAIGVIIADNVAGSPTGIGGTDATVTIPAVIVSQADGAALKTALARRSRTASGVIASLGINANQFAGADPFGRALLYTPNPFDEGSSVAHFDPIAFPNLLMEPNINGDEENSVVPPADLTFPLLQDIGW